MLYFCLHGYLLPVLQTWRRYKGTKMIQNHIALQYPKCLLRKYGQKEERKEQKQQPISVTEIT